MRNCEQCDIPICVQCVSSQKYKTHDVKDISMVLERKRQDIQAYLEELGNRWYPLFQSIASSFPVRRANLKRNTAKCISSIIEHGEVWHREIDNIIRNLKSDIEKTESEHMVFLKKQEEKIYHFISKMKQTIAELKKLKDFQEVNLLSKYKSRNEKFKITPTTLSFTLPSFSSQRIDSEQLSHQFGSLTGSRNGEVICNGN